MTFDEFLKSREVGDEGVENLLTGMSAFQVKLARQMTEAMSALEVRGGVLVASEANMANLATIMDSLKKGFADPEWEGAVKEYLRTFNSLGENVIAYSGGAVDAALIKAMRLQYKTVAGEYLLSGSSFSSTGQGGWLVKFSPATSAKSQFSRPSSLRTVSACSLHCSKVRPSSGRSASKEQ